VLVLVLVGEGIVGAVYTGDTTTLFDTGGMYFHSAAEVNEDTNTNTAIANTNLNMMILSIISFRLLTDINISLFILNISGLMTVTARMVSLNSILLFNYT
jgi:hypothetical protein